MTTTCNHALYAVVDVYTQHYTLLAPLLEELLGLITWCVRQESEELARSGMNCLENLVIGAGHSFIESTWDKVVDTIVEVYSATLPATLRTWKPDLNAHFDQMSVHSDSLEADNTQLAVTRADRALFLKLDIGCSVQIEIIQTVDNIVFFPASSAKEDLKDVLFYESGELSETPPEGMFSYLSSPQLFRIVDCLIEAHKFSKGFNRDIDQRRILWKYGFKGKQVPDLEAQEIASLLCALRVLYKIYIDESRVDEWQKAELYLHRLTVESLEYYIMLEEPLSRGSWAKIVRLLLKKMILLDDERFLVLLAKCYNQLCHMLAQENEKELQIAISKFFLRAEQPLFKTDNQISTGLL